MQNTIYEYIAPELWTLMDLGVHFGPGLFIVCGAQGRSYYVPVGGGGGGCRAKISE